MKVLKFVLLYLIVLIGFTLKAAEKNETERAMAMFNKMLTACKTINMPLLWAQYSSREGPRNTSKGSQAKVFKQMCTGVTDSTINNLKQYDFYLTQKQALNGYPKFPKTVLCQSMKGKGSAGCREMFDARIENGKMVRDEN